MKLVRTICCPFIIACLFALTSGFVAAAPSSLATATIAPTKGNSVNGTVTFIPEGDEVKIKIDVSGLTPGSHGFHVHAVGDCSAPDASSAGGHFMVGEKQHGAPSAAMHHEGDLGNIEADASGKAKAELESKSLSLSGPNSIIGRAVIVHEKEDDMTTQPTGNAGGRVACGVIKAG